VFDPRAVSNFFPAAHQQLDLRPSSKDGLPTQCSAESGLVPQEGDQLGDVHAQKNPSQEQDIVQFQADAGWQKQ